MKSDKTEVVSIDFKERPFCEGDLAVVPDTMTLIPLETSARFRAMVISVSPGNCEEADVKRIFSIAVIETFGEPEAEDRQRYLA